MGDNEVIEIIDEMTAAADGKLEELVLEGCEIPKFTKAIKEKIEKCKDLTILNLNDCTIESLANFPKLPKLTRLEMFGNPFKGSELKNLVAAIPKVQELHLGDNEIAEYDEVACLAGLKELKDLYLAGCPISEKEDYREKLFSLIPSLEILDMVDKDGNDVAGELEGDEGEEDEEEFEGESEDEDEEYEEEDEDEEYDAKASKNKKKKKN